MVYLSIFVLFFCSKTDYGYSLEHVPTIYILSKSKKNIKFFHLKIIIFAAFKNCCILHRLVCLMWMAGKIVPSRLYPFIDRFDTKEIIERYITQTCLCDILHLSRVMRKSTFWFPTWSDTNQAVQLQKMARGLKFRI